MGIIILYIDIEMTPDWRLCCLVSVSFCFVLDAIVSLDAIVVVDAKQSFWT